jgi:hypothetical protein
MNADRRILTPVAATLLGGIFVGVATLGGTLAGGSAASVAKTDRFATIGDTLCAGQAWPNLTPECLAWVEGTPPTGVRFITVANHDRAERTTTLTRTAVDADGQF